MIPKKNPRIDLERYRALFFLTGLSIALLISILLMDIKIYEPVEEEPVVATQKVYSEENLIPITYRTLPSAPPPLPSAHENITVVEDETELTEEFDMAPTETHQDEVVVSQWKGETAEGPVVTIAVEEEVSEEVLTFELVEIVPVFPGCEGATDNNIRKACFQEKIIEHVSKNFKFPAAALQMNLQGKIFVQFVIERDGSVSNVTVVRGVDAILDNEAIRVIKALPRIEPARQRGKPVRMSFVMPINAIVRNNG